MFPIIKRGTSWLRRTFSSDKPDPPVETGDDLDEALLETADYDTTVDGIRALLLMSTLRTYVHRASELVEIDEPSVAQRSVTVYFAPPEVSAPGLASGGARRVAAVPLAVVRKRRLSLFHVADENGSMIPTLTSMARRDLLTRGLEENAKRLLQNPAHVGELSGTFRDVLSANPETAQAALAKFEEPADAAHGALAQHVEFLDLLRLLAAKLAVLVPMPLDGSRSRVARFSYQESVQRDPLTLEKRAWFVRRAWLGLGKAIAWRATKLNLNASGAVQCRSYHFELRAPAGLQLVNPRLVLIDDAGQQSAVLDRLKGSYLSIHLASHNARGSGAAVRADLRPLGSTVIRGAWFSSLFTSAALAGAGVYLPKLKPPAPAPTLLLIATSLFTLFVSGQGEAAQTSRLVGRLRVMAVIPAVCSFVAAGLIVVGSGDAHTGAIWWWLTGLSGAICVLFTVALWRNRLRRPAPE